MNLILYILFRFIYSLLPGANMKHFFSSLLFYWFKSSSEEKNSSDCSNKKANTFLNNFFCTYVNSHPVYISKYVSEKIILVDNYHLIQNYLNSFNSITKIRWHTLKIFDVLVREVATLVDVFRDAGSYVVEFNTQQTTDNKQLSSGVYFYRLQAGSYISTKKMILTK